MKLLIQLFNRINTFLQWRNCQCLLIFCMNFCLPLSHTAAHAESALEYRVKAAFMYNFIAFTHWPDENTDPTIRLCIYGADPFGNEVDKLESKPIHSRYIKVARISNPEALNDCQVIFFSGSESNLSNILHGQQNKPILTLADSQDAIAQGIVINMSLVHEKIVFEINLGAARRSGLEISSKLLQLASKVHH